MISGSPGPIPLEINNLELWFPSGQTPALVDVNLRLMPGTVTAIIGPAGIGKSTLFKAILSEIAISSGSVKVHGEDVKNGQAVHPDHFSYVPQKTQLKGELTVWETIELATYVRLPDAKSKEERHQVVRDVLKKLSMDHKKDGLVKDLSGGEERRVSIALELVSNPHLILLDEPTSGLDEGLDKELHETLRNLADDERKPAVLFVTHSTTHLNLVDPETNRTYVDQVVAIGRATDNSSTSTIRHIGKPNQILTDWDVNSYSDVMKILRASPAVPAKFSTEKPDINFKRSYKTLSWRRSFIYNLQRQWLLIGKMKGLLKSIRNTMVLGLIIALVLWTVSRLGLGVDLDGPNQEFLTYTSMLVLLLAFGGTLLPIMGIVTSWDVIRREQRWGVSSRSFIWAQMVIQVLLIVPAVIAATVLSLWLTNGPTDQTLLPQTEYLSSYWQLALLLLLSTMASYSIGVLIGCLNTSSNKANYASGAVFAIMLVGNGLIFTWHEFWAVYYPSFLIPSRTGIAMIASNFNAELVMGVTTDKAFGMSVNALYLAMAVMVGIGILFLAIAMFSVKRPLGQTGSGGAVATSGSKGESRQRSLLPAAVVLSALLISGATIYSSRSSGGEVFGESTIAQSAPQQTQAQQPQVTSAPRSEVPTGNTQWPNPTPTAIPPQSSGFAGNTSSGINQPADSFQAASSQQNTQATEAPQTPGTDQSTAPEAMDIPADAPVEAAGDVASSDLVQTSALSAQDSTATADLAGEPMQASLDEIDSPASDEANASTTDAALASDEDDPVDVALEADASVEHESASMETASLSTTNNTPADALDTSASGGITSNYYDIGGDTEPELRRFQDVIDTQSDNEVCDLGGYEDGTKRPQQAQDGNQFAAIIVDVTAGQETTLSFCIEEDVPADDWAIWLGLDPPAEFGCSSVHLSKPGDLSQGLNVVTWTIPAECVHLDRMMLVFSDTGSDGTAIWGVLVEQDPSITAEP